MKQTTQSLDEQIEQILELYADGEAYAHQENKIGLTKNEAKQALTKLISIQEAKARLKDYSQLQKHWHLVGADGVYEAILQRISELETQLGDKSATLK